MKSRDFQRAKQLVDKTLDRCSAKDSTNARRLRLTKARALYYLGDYDSALAILEAASHAALPSSQLRLQALVDQAWVKFLIKDYDRALQLFVKAADESQTAGPAGLKWLADIRARQLYVFAATKDFSSAERIYREAVRLNNDPARTVWLHTSRAWMLMEEGRYEEAANELNWSASKILAMPDQNAHATLHNNLGTCDYHLGNFLRSIAALQKAEPLFRAQGDRANLRLCVNTLGLAHLESGSLQPARHYLLEAVQLASDLKDQPAQADSLANLATVAISARDWTAAENYNRRALELRKTDPDADLFALINEAQIMTGRGDLDGALSTLNGVSRRRSANPARLIDTERVYIAVYRRQRDKARAAQHYRTALKVIARVRAGLLDRENKLAYYGSTIALNQEWVRLLVELGEDTEALDAAESSRALSLHERLEREGLDTAPSRSDYRRLARTRNAALVSYWLAPDESYVWVATPTSLERRTLPGEEKIRALVEAYSAILHNRADPHHADGSGGRLRAAVLDPVLPLLRGAKEVILVADGPLHSVNFESLPVEGRYWIEDVTLSLAPSLRILALAPQRSGNGTRDRSIFVLGDAVPTPDFPRLQKVSTEIQEISNTFPGQATTVRGVFATPEAYLAAPLKQNYIHFAAHADANAERPLDSAIILSPGKNGERLTARQLLERPIRADLVTVSACRSAGVGSYRGEGLIGFAWAFLQTGARGVIAGLWDASDDSTARIMTDLYARLALGETPPAALRHAKLVLVHADSHFRLPYYWAPFQYYAGVGR